MRWPPAQALIVGGLTVGLLDGLDAIVFFGQQGVSPIQIMQSIASGLLGRAAYQGGVATAALGTILHFVVLPLSAAVTGPRILPVVINGLLIHALGVGLPSALFARAATRATA